MKTAQFLHENIPKLSPPDGRVYQYFAYKPNERPFRYVKGKLPEKFLPKVPQLPRILRAFNHQLNYMIDDDGETKVSYIEVNKVGEVVEKKLDNGKIERKFEVVFEIARQLITPLVQLKAVVKFINTTVKLSL